MMPRRKGRPRRCALRWITWIASVATLASAPAAAAIPWRTWAEVSSADRKDDGRPVYVFLGSRLSELSRATDAQTFSRPETAQWLTDHFTCVRIDAAQEPEIAAFIRDLVERVRGQKGPPYHVWLTPRLAPFEAAGYLPPSEEWSQPGFLRTARAARDAWHANPTGVAAAAAELRHLALPETPSARLPPTAALLERGTRAWLDAEDRSHGGFGDAPKEPHPDVIRFLLQRGPEARAAALRAAGALVQGALQDPGTGGFFRRTIDEAWREPYRQHLLVDQALIAHALYDAADAGGRADWSASAHRALRFALTRLRTTDGGFSEAIDRTDGAEADAPPGAAPLGAQGLLLAALWRAGSPLAAEAEALTRVLRLSTLAAASPAAPGSATLGVHDALGVAAGLSRSPHPEDRQHARALAAYAERLFLDARTGAFWAISADRALALPWRPLALPTPLRPAAIALSLGTDAATHGPLQRALRHAIEFDPLPPPDILLALAAAEGPR